MVSAAAALSALCVPGSPTVTGPMPRPPPVDLEAGGIGRDQDVANTQVSISRASIRHDTRSIEQDMSIRVVHTHRGDTWDIIDERTKGCLQPIGRTV